MLNPTTNNKNRERDRCFLWFAIGNLGWNRKLKLYGHKFVRFERHPATMQEIFVVLGPRSLTVLIRLRDVINYTPKKMIPIRLVLY